MKYRKKPVVINAVRWTGWNITGEIGCNGERLPVWFKDAVVNGVIRMDRIIPIIHTLEGDHEVTSGDYIIRGIKGELYPCKPDIFAASYEEVKDE